MSRRKVALITGSTKGIGWGIAERLAQDGMAVVLNYRDDEGEAKRALERMRQLASEAIIIKADVSKPDQARSLIEKAVEHFERLDVLVNNVGTFIVKPTASIEVEEWQKIIDENLNCTFYCTKSALPVMRKRRGGNIVNIGSLNAEVVRGTTNTAPYSVAKTGVAVLTKSLARSEAQYNIRVNMVNPGFIETYASTEEMKESMAKEVPLGYLGKPKDIAEAVAFLVSDKARYITGAILNVHGGLWV